MKYFIHPEDYWIAYTDSRTGYSVVENYTTCASCHIFLSGYDGPRLALCEKCFNDESKRHTNYNIRKTFG